MKCFQKNWGNEKNCVFRRQPVSFLNTKTPIKKKLRKKKCYIFRSISLLVQSLLHFWQNRMYQQTVPRPGFLPSFECQMMNTKLFQTQNLATKVRTTVPQMLAGFYGFGRKRLTQSGQGTVYVLCIPCRPMYNFRFSKQTPIEKSYNDSRKKWAWHNGVWLRGIMHKAESEVFHFFIVFVVVTRAYLRSGQDYAWVLRVAIPTM